MKAFIKKYWIAGLIGLLLIFFAATGITKCSNNNSKDVISISDANARVKFAVDSTRIANNKEKIASNKLIYQVGVKKADSLQRKADYYKSQYKAQKTEADTLYQRLLKNPNLNDCMAVVEKQRSIINNQDTTIFNQDGTIKQLRINIGILVENNLLNDSIISYQSNQIKVIDNNFKDYKKETDKIIKGNAFSATLGKVIIIVETTAIIVLSLTK